MKLNWGHALVIFFCLFIAALFTFVMLASSKTFDLQSEDYYLEELNFQTQIDKKKNVKRDSVTVEIVRSEEGVNIKFPESFDPNSIEGTLLFYRPSNAKWDYEVKLKPTSQNTQEVRSVRFKPGVYLAKMDFSHKGTPYYLETQIFY